jgi:hypothetical protein
MWARARPFAGSGRFRHECRTSRSRDTATASVRKALSCASGPASLRGPPPAHAFGRCPAISRVTERRCDVRIGNRSALPANPAAASPRSSGARTMYSEAAWHVAGL